MEVELFCQPRPGCANWPVLICTQHINTCLFALILESITRRHWERTVDQIVPAWDITGVVRLGHNAALIQWPSGVDILAATARVILMVVAAVSTCVVVEKMVLGHKKREVAFVLEGAGCVDLVVGGGDWVVVNVSSPEFLAFAAGSIVKDDLAGFGSGKGG